MRASLILLFNLIALCYPALISETFNPCGDYTLFIQPSFFHVFFLRAQHWFLNAQHSEFRESIPKILFRALRVPPNLINAPNLKVPLPGMLSSRRVTHAEADRLRQPDQPAEGTYKLSARSIPPNSCDVPTNDRETDAESQREIDSVADLEF